MEVVLVGSRNHGTVYLKHFLCLRREIKKHWVWWELALNPGRSLSQQTFGRSYFLIPLTYNIFCKKQLWSEAAVWSHWHPLTYMSWQSPIPSNCRARHYKDITSTSFSDNNTRLYLYPQKEDGRARIVPFFLTFPVSATRPSLPFAQLTRIWTIRHDTSSHYVPSGDSTWIRYRKEASRAIVRGLTQAVDWTVGLLLCWYCWSRAHCCGTAWTAEA